MSNESEDKIILATRVYKDNYEVCKSKLLSFSNKNIAGFYIICDLQKKPFKENGKYFNVIFDSNPIRPTAFNLVIDELNKDKINQYHLLTFSQEVELEDENIETMIKELKEDLIVVGYRLRDNVLSDKELELYSNGKFPNVGIAYQVPWNTCALWNRKFIYGENLLKFDEICEKDKNQLGKLKVKVNGEPEDTDYEGMEDGLAIAELINKNPELKFKLIEEELSWNIQGNEDRIKKQKKKMARKNIVLSTFINIKGYSIEALSKARKL
jgi:hypothetical protein